jgi:hypothetical protein
MEVLLITSTISQPWCDAGRGKKKLVVQKAEKLDARELDGHGECVQLESQHDLLGRPVSITFQHLLDQSGFLSMRVITGIKATQDFIQKM